MLLGIHMEMINLRMVILRVLTLAVVLLWKYSKNQLLHLLDVNLVLAAIQVEARSNTPSNGQEVC